MVSVGIVKRGFENLDLCLVGLRLSPVLLASDTSKTDREREKLTASFTRFVAGLSLSWFGKTFGTIFSFPFHLIIHTT